MKLRDYQIELHNQTIQAINDNVKKILIYLPTGGGKSILIAYTARELSKLGRVLILTHRAEILKQNSEWLDGCGILTAAEDNVKMTHRIVISMVQTLHSRLKNYSKNYIGQFDYIIVDEAHVLIFDKVYEIYEYKNLIGYTGSPSINKKDYKTIDEVKYSRDLSLRDYFDKLIYNIDTQDLVDMGFLVQDYNVTLLPPNYDELVESNSNPDGYTSASLNRVYGNSASIDVLYNAYNEYAKNKKTIIFNPTTKVNEYVYNKFAERVENVFMYDSVNGGDREKIVRDFDNLSSGVLINANVFTTGFNVTDIEVIIVNRATKSLSLWLQMVGRGSRTTTKKYKDKFIVIDLGQNIFNHGIWSLKRNWQSMFVINTFRSSRNNDLLKVWTCNFCQSFNSYNDLKCVYCGESLEDSKLLNAQKELKFRNGDLKIVSEMPLPKAEIIITYTKSINEDGNFAFQLLEQQILMLFKHYNVTKSFYDNRRAEFVSRVREIYLPIYFAIIKSDLKGKNKKLETQISTLLTKINKLYE